MAQGDGEPAFLCGHSSPWPGSTSPLPRGIPAPAGEGDVSFGVKHHPLKLWSQAGSSFSFLIPFQLSEGDVGVHIPCKSLPFWSSVFWSRGLSHRLGLCSSIEKEAWWDEHAPRRNPRLFIEPDQASYPEEPSRLLLKISFAF